MKRTKITFDVPDTTYSMFLKYNYDVWDPADKTSNPTEGTKAVWDPLDGDNVCCDRITSEDMVFANSCR